MPITVSIIGPAHNVHRGYDAYKQMVENVHKCIISLGLNPQEVTLVSGGAAWSDHVAVSLYKYNGYKDIIVWSPCKFTDTGFLDNGQYSWTVNPGKTANTYHAKFKELTGIDSIA